MSFRDAQSYGLIFCDENVLAGHLHGREEVSKATERVKENYPTAFLTVENIVAVYQMNGTRGKDESSEEVDDHVEWVGKEDNTTTYFAASESKKLEQMSPCPAFLHGIGLDSHNDEECLQRFNEERCSMSAFDAQNIDRHANRPSAKKC